MTSSSLQSLLHRRRVALSLLRIQALVLMRLIRSKEVRATLPIRYRLTRTLRKSLPSKISQWKQFRLHQRTHKQRCWEKVHRRALSSLENTLVVMASQCKIFAINSTKLISKEPSLKLESKRSSTTRERRTESQGSSSRAKKTKPKAKWRKWSRSRQSRRRSRLKQWRGTYLHSSLRRSRLMRLIECGSKTALLPSRNRSTVSSRSGVLWLSKSSIAVLSRRRSMRLILQRKMRQISLSHTLIWMKTGHLSLASINCQSRWTWTSRVANRLSPHRMQAWVESKSKRTLKARAKNQTRQS